MRQVISNLVVNALKYWNREEPVRVELDGAADAIRFRVRNAGTLPEARVTADLFDPLTRGAAEPHQPPDAGLGLGLYIVKEIVRAHHGTVDARSNAGETAFTASFPRIASVA